MLRKALRGRGAAGGEGTDKGWWAKGQHVRRPPGARVRCGRCPRRGNAPAVSRWEAVLGALPAQRVRCAVAQVGDHHAEDGDAEIRAPRDRLYDEVAEEGSKVRAEDGVADEVRAVLGHGVGLAGEVRAEGEHCHRQEDRAGEDVAQLHLEVRDLRRGEDRLLLLALQPTARAVREVKCQEDGRVEAHGAAGDGAALAGVRRGLAQLEGAPDAGRALQRPQDGHRERRREQGEREGDVAARALDVLAALVPEVPALQQEKGHADGQDEENVKRAGVLALLEPLHADARDGRLEEVEEEQDVLAVLRLEVAV